MDELGKTLCINWEALTAIGTFAAVLVALWPIYKEALRNRAQARSLRFRLCSKLTILRPSLAAVVNSGVATTPAAALSQDEFREAVGSVEAMMQESAALVPPEQDQLGVVLANLEMAARLYGTTELHPDSASNTLSLIDQAVAIMSEHGLLTGKVISPWKK